MGLLLCAEPWLGGPLLCEEDVLEAAAGLAWPAQNAQVTQPGLPESQRAAGAANAPGIGHFWTRVWLSGMQVSSLFLHNFSFYLCK